MNDGIRSEIAGIAADARSGATAILARAIAVLRRAAADRDDLEAAAEALCRAQPSMAAVRVAGGIALNASDPIGALDEFAARTTRAPRIIARLAVGLLTLRRTTGPVRIVTCSRSQAVEQALLALAREVDVEVACAESRPALEGRDLATALTQAGVRVTVYSDAAIGSAIAPAEALLAGADAIGPDAFINKVGTGALAALAGVEGVPVYILAGREKCVSARTFASLSTAGGSGRDIWQDPPAGVSVANPYFECVRATLATAFVTDSGVIGPVHIAQLCKA